MTHQRSLHVLIAGCAARHANYFHFVILIIRSRRQNQIKSLFSEQVLFQTLRLFW
jgi:hypothetical protein